MRRRFKAICYGFWGLKFAFLPPAQQYLTRPLAQYRRNLADAEALRRHALIL